MASGVSCRWWAKAWDGVGPFYGQWSQLYVCWKAGNVGQNGTTAQPAHPAAVPHLACIVCRRALPADVIRLRQGHHTRAKPQAAVGAAMEGTRPRACPCITRA